MRNNTIIILFSILTILMLQSCFHRLASSDIVSYMKTNPRKFDTQGEKERYDIKQIFRHQYHIQSYDKHNGQINIINTKDSSLISFDAICVRLYFEHDVTKFKKIFTSGLISDQLGGLRLNDTLSVCDFENLNYTNNLKTQRRYSFLVYSGFMRNPSRILIELTNKNSNSHTDFDTFIKEAKMTFFLNAWLQL